MQNSHAFYHHREKGTNVLDHKRCYCNGANEDHCLRMCLRHQWKQSLDRGAIFMQCCFSLTVLCPYPGSAHHHSITVCLHYLRGWMSHGSGLTLGSCRAPDPALPPGSTSHTAAQATPPPHVAQPWQIVLLSLYSLIYSWYKVFVARSLSIIRAPLAPPRAKLVHIDHFTHGWFVRSKATSQSKATWGKKTIPWSVTTLDPRTCQQTQQLSFEPPLKCGSRASLGTRQIRGAGKHWPGIPSWCKWERRTHSPWGEWVGYRAWVELWRAGLGPEAVGGGADNVYDKGQVNAVCLLSSSRSSAAWQACTRALIRASHWWAGLFEQEISLPKKVELRECLLWEVPYKWPAHGTFEAWVNICLVLI